MVSFMTLQTSMHEREKKNYQAFDFTLLLCVGVCVCVCVCVRVSTGPALCVCEVEWRRGQAVFSV